MTAVALALGRAGVQQQVCAAVTAAQENEMKEMTDHQRQLLRRAVGFRRQEILYATRAKSQAGQLLRSVGHVTAQDALREYDDLAVVLKEVLG